MADHTDAASALMALAGNNSTSSRSASDRNRDDEDGEMNGDMTPGSPSKNSSSSTNRFPEKLMAVLESNEYTEIIAWTPEGKSFIFLNSNSFERVVLPSIFKVAKFDSFLRKLYRWGFSKCQTHSRVGCPAYKHEKFIRDEPHLMRDMECRSKPKTQYGNVAPMTLTSFHQSAPQLGGPKNGLNSDQNSNAGWDQKQLTTSSRSQYSQDGDAEMMDTSMDDDVSDNAMASLLARQNARSFLNNGLTQQSVNEIMAQQRLLNEQAASMGRNLIGDNMTAAQILAQRQFQASMAERPFSSRSKTTPFNMKYTEESMEPNRSPNPNSSFAASSETSTFSSNSEPRTRNPFLQQANISSLVGHSEPHLRNPLFEQMDLGNMGPHTDQNRRNQLLHGLSTANDAGLSQLGIGGPGSMSIAAKLQELRMREREALLRNADMSSEIQALRLIRQERERNNAQYQNRMILQQELDRLEQLRMFQESQRLAQERHAENEARRALIEKLTKQGNHSFGP